MIGRANEMAGLTTALDRADLAEPSLMLVSGEAGVGKSRLVAEFLRRAKNDDDGRLILTGVCAPMADAGAPYGPVLMALRSLARRSDGNLEASPRSRPDAQVFERELGLAGGILAATVATSRSTETTERLRLFESLLDLFQRLARDRTVVLAVEDLQWADRSTRDFLDFLVRCVSDIRILVVATVRTDEVDRDHAFVTFLAELLRNPHVERIELAPFGPAEVRELVESIDGRPATTARIENIVMLADGNPFYVEELAAASDGTGGGGTASLPGSVREIVLSRVAGLSDPARTIIRLAAVAGRSVDHATLLGAAGMDDSSLDAALDEAIERRLIDYDSEREAYRFRHGLVREAVYADLLPGDRRRSHLALAHVLEAVSVGPPSRVAAEIATHYDRAGEPDRARDASIRAAEAAERLYAVREAARHYERALELEVVAGPPSLGHEALVLRAAQAAARAGDPHRAVELVSALLKAAPGASSDRSRAADLHGTLAAYLRDAGDEKAAMASSRTAVALLADAPDPAVEARVLAAHGRMLMLMSESNEAELVCARAVAVARAAQATSDEASALISLGVVIAGLGRTEEGVDHLRAGLALAEAAGDAEDMARAYLNIDYVYWMAGRLEEALATSMAGIQALTRLGLEWTWGSRLLVTAGEKLFELGRWDEASVLIDQAAARHPSGIAGFTTSVDRVQLPLNRGDFDLAEAYLNDARDLGVGLISATTMNRFWSIAAQLDIWRGRPAEARAAVAEGIARVVDEDRATTLANLTAIGIRCDADLAAIARGRHETTTVEELVADADALLAAAEAAVSAASADGIVPSGAGGPAMLAFLDLARAEHGRARGRSLPGSWTRTADGFAAMGMLHRIGYARYRQAEALLEDGGNGLRRGLP